MAAAQVQQLDDNCTEFGIPLHGLGSPEPGHRPRHRARARADPAGDDDRVRRLAHGTHGAFGALAFGIGTSEVEMVLATQTPAPAPAEDLRGPGRRPARGRGQRQGHHPGPDRPDRRRRRHRPRLRVHRRGDPRPDHGTADDRLQHEHRGRRAGRPDRARRHDLRVRRAAGRMPRRARPGTRRWPAGGRCPTDAGATYDKSITIDADALEPMVTYGTNPGMGIPIAQPGPVARATRPIRPPRRALEHALEYMDLRPGQAILGQKVDVVFIGSCTNGRISDLRLAASRPQGPPHRGRRPADGRARLPGGEDARPRARAWPRSSRRPAPSGARPAARCASP